MPQRKLDPTKLQEALDALARHGSITAASCALNLPRPTLEHRVREARRQGYSSTESPTEGTSTLYGPDGQVKLQWVKAKPQQLSREAIIEAVREALAGTKPMPAIKAPRASLASLVAVYPMGDPHFGQYSWGEETGDDYDLGIAEGLHVDAMDYLVSRAPQAATALIVNVGDYFHANDHKSRTPQSQHILDVDTRHRKVISAGVRAQRRMIELALQKHKNVRVINVAGNHDPEAHLVLPIALELLYENNPRVTIDNSPAKFVYHQHGKVLIGVTHGDTVKLEKLGELMACDQREAWGQTSHHHWITGHWHHRRFFEGPGFTAEVLRTLAGKDAYAASHVYRSERDMQAVVFDAEDGETERYRVGVKMLRKAA